MADAEADRDRVQRGQHDRLGGGAHLLRAAVAVPRADRARLDPRPVRRSGQTITRRSPTSSPRSGRARRPRPSPARSSRSPRIRARPGSCSSSASRLRCGRRRATSAPSCAPRTSSGRLPEGRSFFKLRPLQILVTLVDGDHARAGRARARAHRPGRRAPSADSIGVGDTALPIWDIAKWPVLLGVVILMFAVLYYAAPNVKLPGFRWITPGAPVAVVVWLLASARSPSTSPTSAPTTRPTAPSAAIVIAAGLDVDHEPGAAASGSS